jgi:hypothetical protein
LRVKTNKKSKGGKKAIRWLLKTYTEEEIKEILKNPQRGMWLKSVLDYWLKYFDIKIPKFTYELALLSLKPRPKLIERFFREQERRNKKYHQRLKALGLNTF